MSPLASTQQPLSEVALAQFARDGYLVERQLADPALCAELASYTDKALQTSLAPLEYESEVRYPGAPDSKLAQGGWTPRRLLFAYTRDQRFREWATSDAVISRLKQLMGSERLLLSQNHHNCIMTKHPGFSSMTSWHEDVRYWSFDRPELVSVWLALGDEFPDNGGMLLMPGTHQAAFDRGRLDAALFLRTDLKSNQALIKHRVSAELKAGDVLFFHCKTYHAAGKNVTRTVKRSVVFTYRSEDNRPIPDTKSDRYPDIPLFSDQGPGSTNEVSD